MKLVVASGKGGTGKTTVATNLALVGALERQSVAYVDCDVEEPNGHLFLRPVWEHHETATRLVPQIDSAKCTSCGSCAEACQFNSLVLVGGRVLTYVELCHSCGGCMLACPESAITERPHELGALDIGMSGNIHFTRGLLKVGEAMSPPLIRQVKSCSPAADLTIIDAPPGTSCPAIEAVRGSDLVLLVTEPTPFGLHDLRLAVQMVQCLKMPMAVVINRADVGDARAREYCRAHRLPILAEIPDDHRIAEAYSRGEPAANICDEYRTMFAALLADLMTLANSSQPGACQEGAKR